MNAPRISVLMPFRNEEAYLAGSLDSIRGQTFQHFEVILVDDCSTDAGRSIAQSVCSTDSRFRLLVNNVNLGQSGSMNRALECATGTFVALMDADDIALPTRFATQQSFLMDHPNIDMVGAWQRHFDGGRGVKRFPETDEEIKALLLFKMAISHPLFFFRRDSWLKNDIRYDPNLRISHDREILSRAALKLRLANIPQILLKYRIHKGQTSVERSSELKANTQRVVLWYFRERFPGAAADEIDSFAAVMAAKRCRDFAEFERVANWMESFSSGLPVANTSDAFVPRVAARRMFVFCKANTFLGYPVFRTFAASSLARHRPYSVRGMSRFLLRCILRKG